MNIKARLRKRFGHTAPETAAMLHLPGRSAGMLTVAVRLRKGCASPLIEQKQLDDKLRENRHSSLEPESIKDYERTTAMCQKSPGFRHKAGMTILDYQSSFQSCWPTIRPNEP